MRSRTLFLHSKFWTFTACTAHLLQATAGSPLTNMDEALKVANDELALAVNKYVFDNTALNDGV